MADVLSQDEIDALLSAISTGEVDIDKAKSEEEEKKIKLYDFKRPDKFSKDQLRTLQMIHETFSRLITTMLSGQLRTSVQIQVTSVDQISYQEFIRSIPELTLLTIYEMGTLEGSAILEINPSIAYTIIDRLFGGNGFKELEIYREPTDIESKVMEKILSKILGYLSEAWKDVTEVMPRIEQMESNPQFIQIVGPNEMVVVISFEIKVGNKSGIMNICYPSPLIDPIVSKLSAQYWFSNLKKEKTEENFEIIRERLNKVKVPLIVNLGEIDINFNEFIKLQVGDVLSLNTSIDKSLSVLVGNKEKFKALPGLQGKKMAISIEEVIEEGSE
ncbi:flagellar motor switch protein FliM [Hypnocyclicus thermotrophus]|uniref:Flagellar motor switch protein FliM n=1 Tax=Hypnocyclicus thermotrophus TaxID=1627895 RepID=A0AA46DXL6_9FUSO|nr:flagellar motor switch protein FliM [Hypnocyclicus thermotrophus]TDT68555.1 flagellar motor switch protein FliM [Hypnocyclicus thermotrophus]